ncbi:hypothetical protein [Porcipelethomonas sp.]|uniref:hypothetical protein n=1 Tax=Porcipelethomonas sp. TaxID=2981675 RepID=UPI003EF34753
MARSAEGNEHLINSNTYQLIIEGLFTTLTNVNFDDDAIQNQIALVLHMEQARLTPNCSGCASPCGKNADYDMSELWNADENIRSLNRNCSNYNAGKRFGYFAEIISDTNSLTNY